MGWSILPRQHAAFNDVRAQPHDSNTAWTLCLLTAAAAKSSHVISIPITAHTAHAVVQHLPQAIYPQHASGVQHRGPACIFSPDAPLTRSLVHILPIAGLSCREKIIKGTCGPAEPPWSAFCDAPLEIADGLVHVGAIRVCGTAGENINLH